MSQNGRAVKVLGKQICMAGRKLDTICCDPCNSVVLCTFSICLCTACRPAASDSGQQLVGEDYCAWELLQLFYVLAPRLEGSVTQVCTDACISMLCRRRMSQCRLDVATAHAAVSCPLTCACLHEADCESVSVVFTQSSRCHLIPA